MLDLRRYLKDCTRPNNDTEYLQPGGYIST